MSYIRKLYLESIKKNHHPLEIESCYYILSLISINEFKSMLEIGTGNGFSSTFFALKSELKTIKTIEKNEVYYNNINKLKDKVRYVLANAFEYQDNDKYDIILIDGPKSNQELLFEKYQNYLTSNGIIIVDNIFLKRLVNKDSKQALKLLNKNHNFVKYLKSKKDWDIKIVNVGDGLAICKRKEKHMKISVTCGSYSLALKMIELGVDNIIVGLKDYCCRFNDALTIDEIKSLCDKKADSKITVCLNDIYFEQQIDSLTLSLKQLNNLNIDYLMFHDFAIPQICYEQNLNLNLHYSPETMVTSYGQFDFYLKNKITRVSLATELMTNEMKKIGQNKKEMEVYIKGFGLGFVMHSRWPMLSNFLKHVKANQHKFNDLPYWEIKEDLRKYPNIIYEDKSGTHMLTGYFLSCIKRIKELRDSNIDGLIIDSLFIKDDSLIQIVNIFKQALNKIEDQQEIENLFEKQKEFVDHIVSEGFFGKMGDILHTLKNEDSQESE